MVANKKAASMLFRAVVSTKKAVGTSKQATNYGEAVKGLEMAGSMSRVDQQAVSMMRDQPQPVEVGKEGMKQVRMYRETVKCLEMAGSMSIVQWQVVNMTRAQ